MNVGTVKQASENPIKINQRIVRQTDATNYVASDMELEANDNFLIIATVQIYSTIRARRYLRDAG